MHTIQIITQEATRNKWSYPQQFEALKNAGVTSYDVHFINGYRYAYTGDFGVWSEPVPAEYVSPPLSNVFSDDKVKDALAARAQGKTTYLEFITNLAAAGVSHYTVDMSLRIIHYYNESEDHYYEQIVPEWKK